MTPVSNHGTHSVRLGYPRRRVLALALGVAIVVAGVSVVAGRSDEQHAQAGTRLGAQDRAAAVRRHDLTRRSSAARATAHLQVSSSAQAGSAWTPVALVHGRPAAWLAQRSGVTLMRVDQGLAHLTLHAGSSDGGTVGWTYGDRITPREIHLLIAAFNGGFKLAYPNVGFVSGGHVAVALKRGLASVVTYTDGQTNIGAWDAGVPSSRQRVFSVLQNQQLLVDHGVAAANVSSCILTCWGGTVELHARVARSGLGVTAGGQLVWAAGRELLPGDLASALIAAGAVRAIELDINPDWVAGYLYLHHPSGPVPVALVPGQLGVAGELLEPYSRDFFAVVANQP